MTRELRRIFQSLIGFLNIVGAMNGQNQLEMDMEKISDDAQLITSSYVPEEDDRESTDANIVYNFSPSVGFAGERFVVSSSKTLARQLTMAKTAKPETIDDNTNANLNASVLRDVLADNREQLIAQNMLEDGNSREEAEAIIDLLLQVVDYFQDASLRLGADRRSVGGGVARSRCSHESSPRSIPDWAWSPYEPSDEAPVGHAQCRALVPPRRVRRNSERTRRQRSAEARPMWSPIWSRRPSPSRSERRCKV